MNRLSTAQRAHVVSCLVEGNSLRATARITGVARMTIEKLLRDMGTACRIYHDETVRSLKSQRVQCDEIWSFCYAKKKNVTPTIAEKHADAGDIWTWTALDADSKLIISWAVGDRSAQTAVAFMDDVASRLASRVQMTTDGYTMYLHAVDMAFGEAIDYATLTKIFGGGQDGRYSPPKFKGAQRATIKGRPDAGHVSTSFVERQNLTMRMHMRRFTRLTNAFSKKIEMHEHAVALHFMHYNFCRIHQSLRVTPAMEAGIANRVWSIEDLVRLLP